MVRLAGALAVLVLAAVAAVAYLALQPDSRTTLDDPSDAVVECAAASGLDEAACRAWGVATVAAGAPSNTFELTDLGRLRLDRGLFGLASTCRADWFTTRYATDAAWTAEIPCPGP
ncbi:MAG: hypothetical protein ABI622_01495 [Chloroflexota bacterium]